MLQSPLIHRVIKLSPLAESRWKNNTKQSLIVAGENASFSLVSALRESATIRENQDLLCDLLKDVSAEFQDWCDTMPGPFSMSIEQCLSFT